MLRHSQTLFTTNNKPGDVANKFQTTSQKIMGPAFNPFADATGNDFLAAGKPVSRFNHHTVMSASTTNEIATPRKRDFLKRIFNGKSAPAVEPVKPTVGSNRDYTKPVVMPPLLPSDNQILLSSQVVNFVEAPPGQTVNPRMFQILNVVDKPAAKDGKVDKKGLPKVGCMPGCTCNHVHSYDYDYSKNYKDPLNQRPGEFVEYNWMAKNYGWLKEDSKGVVCNGNDQTPINLETGIEILEDFQDKDFTFEYKDIDPKEQLKYNQKGQQFQLVMQNDKPEDNYLKTSTISLFDKHIDSATLYGLQYHFHAPSEHSVNGQLLDLEMHIVHALEPKHVNPEDPKDKSQFTNGVLGFLFKAVPDDFEFEMNGLTDFHDRFLNTMLDAEKKGKGGEKIDLTKFVKLLKFNRRWTYQGSLTTAPFSEGILWNVLEQVIPVRQSTLEKFLDYRKVEQEKVFNEFEDDAEKEAIYAKNAIQPDNVKPFEDKKGDTFFRVAACNRVVQDQGDRAVYHIDIEE